MCLWQSSGDPDLDFVVRPPPGLVPAPDFNFFSSLIFPSSRIYIPRQKIIIIEFIAPYCRNFRCAYRIEGYRLGCLCPFNWARLGIARIHWQTRIFYKYRFLFRLYFCFHFMQGNWSPVSRILSQKWNKMNILDVSAGNSMQAIDPRLLSFIRLRKRWNWIVGQTALDIAANSEK